MKRIFNGGSVAETSDSRPKGANIEIVKYCIGVDVLGQPVYITHYI